ncbi:hypothetical protein YC2023_071108 [Brassica napus]
MDNNRGVKIYLDQGVVSSVRDENKQENKDRCSSDQDSTELLFVGNGSYIRGHLRESVSENQSNEMSSRNEEILIDAIANDDMVVLKELTIIPHIQEDENENSDEVGDERDNMEELAVVTPVVH